MPAQAVLLHPREDLGRRPVAAQPHLDEVAAVDGTRLDQPAHRRAVAGEHAPVLVGGVGVSVEMDHADAARVTRWATALADGQVVEWSPPKMIGSRPVARPRAPYDRPSRGRARSTPGATLASPARLRRGGRTARSRLERVAALRVRRLANGARPEAGAGPVADCLIHRRADDGDVWLALSELVRVLDERPVAERQGDARVRGNFGGRKSLYGLSQPFRRAKSGATCLSVIARVLDGVAAGSA